jgi:hypothetical protein
MVTLTSSFEQVHFLCPEGRADRPMGTTTSQGYAKNVPAYFRRENPTNQYGNNNRRNGDRIKVNGNNGSLVVKKLDDLKADIKPSESIPYIGKIEKLLDLLGSLIDRYQPLTRRKVLVQTADFLKLQERIRDVLDNIELGSETTSYYEIKYAELVEMANEKCQSITKLKTKGHAESKDDN